jgi:outer membrane protein OmpA-like peptidoglycan-associated protein
VWPVFTDVMMGMVFILLLVNIIFLADDTDVKITREIIGRVKVLHQRVTGCKGAKGNIFITEIMNDSTEYLIRFKGDNLFDPLKSILKNENAKTSLQSIGSELRAIQKEKNSRFHEVIIEGHTDSESIPERLWGMSEFRYKNWGLSTDRANQVLVTFIKADLAEEILSARGYADTRPPMQFDEDTSLCSDCRKAMKENGEDPYCAKHKTLMRRIDVRVLFSRDEVKKELQAIQ